MTEPSYPGKVILGISAYYHDSAACLMIGDKVIAAAQEERFTRIKHDQNFPINAVNYALAQANITAKELDYVVFYEKPYLKFDRLLETYLSYAPRGWPSFIKAMPQWLKQKLYIPREIRKALGKHFNGNICFTNHHESHAASAFFPSPFEEAATLTIDGVGEWETCTIGQGKGNKIELLQSMHFPHSLGLLYSAFTYFTGFKVNSGEYKLMGLAPFGTPRFTERIYEHLIDLKEDGSFAMDMSYFNYCQGLRMTGDKFAELFEGPRRDPESEITQREMDLAASIQIVTEEIILRMARYARRTTGLKNLCLAGGVALNCVANGRLIQEKVFDKIWIQPAAGDAGGALGCCYFLHHQLLNSHRIIEEDDSMRGAYLGPNFSDDVISQFLDGEDAVYEHFTNETDLLETASDAIASQKVVGWFQGRMEFGPRALGGRSIIGDARSLDMQSTMNLRIKHRESFRPFAPSVLIEDVTNYFELDDESPYMLIVSEVDKSQQSPISEDDRRRLKSEPDMRKRLASKRSELQAITHVDMSARIQTVDKKRHGRYHRLIKTFRTKTGCSVIINTSFNVRGEPIVCTPEDAYRCFMVTDMDVLVIENYILYKDRQSHLDSACKLDHLKSFALD